MVKLEELEPSPKRFALLAGSTYYPAGGLKDLKGVFGSRIEADRAAMAIADVDWIQIVDLHNGGEIVLEIERKP